MEKAAPASEAPTSSRRRRRAASTKDALPRASEASDLEKAAPASEAPDLKPPLPTLLGGSSSRRWKSARLETGLEQVPDDSLRRSLLATCECPDDCDSQKRCMHCLFCFTFSPGEIRVDCPRTGFPVHVECVGVSWAP